MASGRVDQTSVAGVLRDHKARIRALEALNPETGGGCPPWQNVALLGDPFIGIGTPQSGCSPVVSDPTANITGVVWCCDFSLLTTDTPPGLVQGSVTVALTDPGSAAPGDCGDDFFSFYYFSLPIQAGEVGSPFPNIPTGFGFTYQASTKTRIPAQLVWDLDFFGWGVMVEGTELSNDLGAVSEHGWNMARPDYPFEYAADDILFAGTYIFNPILVA